VQLSSWSFNDLSQVSHLSLVPFSQSHIAYVVLLVRGVLSQLMLSVCSQGHVYTSSLAHTLNHFVEDLPTRPPSINRTSSELHYAVSPFSDQALLPRISQSLRLPPRQSVLHNPVIDLVDYHPEQNRSCLRSYLNLHFPQAYPSSLPLVNQRI